MTDNFETKVAVDGPDVNVGPRSTARPRPPPGQALPAKARWDPGQRWTKPIARVRSDCVHRVRPAGGN